MADRLVFLRHGQSTYNVLGLCNSDPSVSVPLTAVGRVQAQAAAIRLRDVPIDRVFVSELQRARETAEIAMRDRFVPFHVDARLNDRNSGFEGRPVAEYLAALGDDQLHRRLSGGESYQDLKARVAAFLDDLRGIEAKRVLVVSHHEVMQVALGHLNGWSDEEMWRFWIDNGGFVEAEGPDR